MADLKLVRPQTGAKLEISASEETNIVFDFDINEAVMSREVDSNALTFTFTDGSTTVVTNFYDTYTSENMPDFVISDQVIAGKDFFESFDETLMPAAGPAEGIASNGRSTDFDSDELASGNSALGELYVKTFDGSVQSQDDNTENLSESNENTDGDSGANYDAPVITHVSTENANLDASGGLQVNHNIINQNFSSTFQGRAELDPNASLAAESTTNGNNFYATASQTSTWKQSGSNGTHGSLGGSSINVTKEGSSEPAFTMTSVKVTVGENGNQSPKVEEFGVVGYRQYDEGKGGSGITVLTGDGANATTGVTWDNEIAANNKANSAGEYVSEGIMFEIPGNDVHNITLNLTAFYPDDMWAGEGKETATIYFYKDGNLVRSEQISADNKDGTFTYSGYVEDGFDKVVLKPDMQDSKFKYGSSLLVEGVSFSESILPSYTGQLTYDLGTGSEDGGIAFALEDKSTLETDQGDLNIKIVENLNEAGEVTSVTMTGANDDGSNAFTAILNPDGKWTFEATQDITVDGKDFELGFEVTGKNGSTAESSVELDVIVIDSYKTGTDSGDTILGSKPETDDYIKGLDGDDTISGLDGDDKLFGDEGDDTIFGGDGNDLIVGGAGADKLYGGDGNDVIKFDLNDIVDGGSGHDVAIGGTMDDILGSLENGKMDNVELFLTGNGSTSITDMGDLDSIGISFDTNGDVNFDSDKWTAGDTDTLTNGNQYVEVTSGEGANQITALVDQAVFHLNYTT